MSEQIKTTTVDQLPEETNTNGFYLFGYNVNRAVGKRSVKFAFDKITKLFGFSQEIGTSITTAPSENAIRTKLIEIRNSFYKIVPSINMLNGTITSVRFKGNQTNAYMYYKSPLAPFTVGLKVTISFDYELSKTPIKSGSVSSINAHKDGVSFHTLATGFSVNSSIALTGRIVRTLTVSEPIADPASLRLYAVFSGLDDDLEITFKNMKMELGEADTPYSQSLSDVITF